jgi:gamma-glutamylcysteine synthetase
LRNVVDKKFERRLAGLINSGEKGVLRGGRKGVEKESLRVSPDGDIVQTRHPAPWAHRSPTKTSPRISPNP